MAKVMISIPDDLLRRLDEHAQKLGMSRSGLLRRLAEQELVDEDAARREAILGILASARDHGGDSTEFIHAMRRSR
jgi:metal-responsive CopG/Arc/MetJ family transcriptional regulator